ncbi:hypothetical protein L6164_024861 [Bauhinia variegata]|uniref:Uncharacterized protein n=1 Tax=Bauhinia variegata TaxID=167791 RepID=A0ACB9M0A5_BAUVA|nr:hypothetical protein L6164_024861 [Bauhinia variegata]
MAPKRIAQLMVQRSRAVVEQPITDQRPTPTKPIARVPPANSKPSTFIGTSDYTLRGIEITGQDSTRTGT